MSPETFDLTILVVFYLTTFFAAVVHGAVGIGFPLIATPLMALVTDVKTAILILVLPTMALNLISILKGGRFKDALLTYWPLAAYGVAGSFIGTRLLVIFPAELFRPLLALLIIIYLNTHRFESLFSWVKTYPKSAVALLGTTAGLAGGTVNVMLPVLVIYALETGLSKTRMIQVFNLCFLFGKATQGAVFLSAGFFNRQIWITAVPITFFCLFVSFLSLRLRDRIHTATYRRWLKLLLAAMAMILILQSVF